MNCSDVLNRTSKPVYEIFISSKSKYGMLPKSNKSITFGSNDLEEILLAEGYQYHSIVNIGKWIL